MEGVLGDVILVNGAPWPVLEVTAARYRLRVLNASNARRYQLALDPPGRPFVQIGSDDGLLARPVEHDAADRSRPASATTWSSTSPRYRVGHHVDPAQPTRQGTTAQVMRFRVARRVRDDSRVPDRLSSCARLDPAARGAHAGAAGSPAATSAATRAG